MKRWLLRILVFLILGAIVNVAVAWGCALFVRTDFAIRWYDRSVAGQPAEWYYYGIDTAGATRIYSRPTSDWEVHEFDRVKNPRRSAEPQWSRIVRESPDEVSPRAEDGRGWPATSMFSIYSLVDVPGQPKWVKDSPPVQFEFPGIWQVDSGIDVSKGYGVNEITSLPLRPIWPGFAINTVFYAAVLWLLFAGPFVVRRRRRIRRGLCPKCAYDLRGTPEATACPECGAARPKN